MLHAMPSAVHARVDWYTRNADKMLTPSMSRSHVGLGAHFFPCTSRRQRHVYCRWISYPTGVEAKSTGSKLQPPLPFQSSQGFEKLVGSTKNRSFLNLKSACEPTSWEEYNQLRRTAERRRRDAEDYRRHVLDSARDRLGDTEYPPDKDELEDIIEWVKNPPADVRNKQVRIVAAQCASVSSPTHCGAKEIYGKAVVVLPNRIAHFRTASASVSADAQTAWLVRSPQALHIA